MSRQARAARQTWMVCEGVWMDDKKMSLPERLRAKSLEVPHRILWQQPHEWAFFALRQQFQASRQLTSLNLIRVRTGELERHPRRCNEHSSGVACTLRSGLDGYYRHYWLWPAYFLCTLQKDPLRFATANVSHSVHFLGLRNKGVSRHYGFWRRQNFLLR